MADEQDQAGTDRVADPAETGDGREPAEGQQVALAAAGARPVRKAAVAAEAGKGHATPKQKRQRDADEHRRATPAEFVRESVGELKKVVWPTGSQLQQYFVVVLVFVLIMIAIVSVLDLGFGSLLLWIFG